MYKIGDKFTLEVGIEAELMLCMTDGSFLGIDETNQENFYFVVNDDTAHRIISCEVWEKQNDIQYGYVGNCEVNIDFLKESCVKWENASQPIIPEVNKCTCDVSTLCNVGCKCGSFQKEQKSKT